MLFAFSDKRRFGLQQLKQPGRRPGSPLQFTNHLTDRTCRNANQQAVEHECRQFTGAYPAMNHIQPANPDHNADRPHHQGNRQSGQPRPLPDALAGNVERLLRHLREKPPVVGLMIEGLHGFDLGKVLPT